METAIPRFAGAEELARYGTRHRYTVTNSIFNTLNGYEVHTIQASQTIPVYRNL